MKRFEENTRSGNFSLKRRVLKSKISKTFNVFFAFFLAAAVVLCYVYPVSLASAADGTGTIDDPRLNLSDPIAHEKTITDNGDGTYTVTLNVTGEVKKTETTPMADVVIVFDRSNSMNTTADGYNNTRLDVAKEATDNLVTKLLTSDTVDARVSLVDFDTYARTYTESGADKDADATAKWYEKDDLTTLTGTIDGIDAPSDNQGATNWEDAMVHTNTALAGARDGATKYVIFVSDGVPTVRNTMGDYYDHLPGLISIYPSGYRWNGDELEKCQYGYGQWWHTVNNRSTSIDESEVDYFGSGNVDLEYSHTENSDYALAQIGSDGSANGNFAGSIFYSVATAQGDGNEDVVGRMTDFANDVTTEAGLESSFYDGTDADSLNKAFTEIANRITMQRTYSDVTITDTLSDWAEFALDGEGVESYTCSITRTNSDGSTTTTELTGQDVAIDTTNKTVTWNIEVDGSTQLEDGATYSISFVIKPNQAAFDRAAQIKQGSDTADDGDEPLDGGDGILYQDMPTIYSNDNDDDNTYVRWREITSSSETTDPEYSDYYKSDYEEPVMHVPVSSLTVTKKWEGGTAESSATIKLQQKNSDGTWSDYTVDGTVQTATLNSGNSWSATFSNLPAGPDGYDYRVVETSPTPNGDTWSTTYEYEITSPNTAPNTSIIDGNQSTTSTDSDGNTYVNLKGRAAQSADATVTNTKVSHSYSLQVNKKGKLSGESDDEARALAGAGFTLSEATVKDSVVTVGDQVGSATSGDDGTLTFSKLLTAGETYILQETTTPSGYVTHDPIVLVVGSDGTVTSYGTTVETADDGTTTITMASTGSELGKVTGDDSTYTMTVVNTMEEVELPSAGGTGFPFAATGLAIAVMAAGALFARRRLLS